MGYDLAPAMDAPPEPRPAACTHCGYLLNSDQPVARCSECGVENLLVDDRRLLLRFADPKWVSRLAMGTTILRWSITAFVADIVLAFLIVAVDVSTGFGILLSGLVGQCVQAIILLILALSAITGPLGMAMVLSPDPRVDESTKSRQSVLRWVLAFSLVPMLASAAVETFVWTPWTWTGPSLRFLTVVLVLLGAANAVERRHLITRASWLQGRDRLAIDTTTERPRTTLIIIVILVLVSAAAALMRSGPLRALTHVSAASALVVLILAFTLARQRRAIESERQAAYSMRGRLQLPT